MSLGTSPDVANLYIGKGIVSFMKTGAGSFTDLGEVPQVELTLTTTVLDYFSSRSGTRAKVRSVVLEAGGNIRILMNEFSEYNMALAMLGSVDALAVGGPSIDILSVNQITGEIKFHGTNDVGPHWDLHLHNVQIKPSRSINLINERDWGGLEFTAEILKSESTGKFGTIQITDAGNVES